MNYVLCFNTRFNNILDCKIKTFHENRNRKIEKRKTDRANSYYYTNLSQLKLPSIRKEVIACNIQTIIY